MQVITYVTYTPLENDETQINWVFLRKPKMPLIDFILNRAFMQGMCKAMIEDKLIVESLSVVGKNRINTSADKIQIKFQAFLTNFDELHVVVFVSFKYSNECIIMYCKGN